METPQAVPGFCRDCLAEVPGTETRCPKCRGPRLKRHPELHSLAIAHIDCDAFYATVEKRDRPDLRDKPVIIGGGTRGVVSTACYVARIRGVKSAMPMFKALALCPDAVVIKPDIRKYAEVGRQVRELMLRLTPLVQPLSIDEAFLDLSGTTRLHGKSPALSLATLLKTVETELGITASAGLSYNKFLAKVASDLEKPRGFSIIGAAEAKAFLAQQSVSLIWGVGKAFQETLRRDGITTIGQLQVMDRSTLMHAYGVMGDRLYHLSRGEDLRHVSPDDENKSISAETTFNTDIADYEALERILWRLSEKVSLRAKREGMAGLTVTLKLKSTDFKIRSRNTTLDDPTQLAHHIFSAAQALLKREATGIKYRLIGVGISHLSAAAEADETPLDTRFAARTKAERAIDALREKFGQNAVERGLALKKDDDA
jgi:DNA polymerase-4